MLIGFPYDIGAKRTGVKIAGHDLGPGNKFINPWIILNIDSFKRYVVDIGSI